MQVLKFTKDMCMECMVTKNMATIEEDFFKEIGISIEEVDVIKNPELTERYGIGGLPTFVLLTEDKEPQYFYKIPGYHELKEAIRDAVSIR